MARVLGLSVVLAAVAFGALPRVSQAATYSTFSQANSACLSLMQDNSGLPGFTAVKPCIDGTLSGEKAVVFQMTYWNGSSAVTTNPQYFTYSTGSRCESATPYQGSYGDNISVCHGGCMYEPKTDQGTTDTVRSGSWLAQLVQTTYVPTGETCPPDAPPEPPQKSRTLCGGGSCHDTAAGKYCANDSSGAQVCVSDKPPPSGACASSGDTTICAGSPPPMPPNPPIADPASSAAASDTYGHQDGNGPITNTTVNNYNNTGSASNNGAQSGDAGNAPDSNNPIPGGSHDPASSSSSGGPKGDATTASGGGDCNSPPICEGSQATCMVVKQTWLLRCPPGGQGTDDSGPAGQDGNTDVPGLDGIGDSPGEGFMRSETVLDKLDQGGLGAGGGTCPKLVSFDLDQYGVHLDADALPWCDILDAIRYMLLFIGAFVSLRILSSK